MKIVTLIENLANRSGLIAEHGLSFYIETDKSKIIFDTGQSSLFLQNAKKLNINIEDVDALVLSHGHYDHTGGLYPFLEANKKAKIFCKKGLFNLKLKDKIKFIGTLKDEKKLEDRLVYVDTVKQIDEQIFIMPNIPIKYQADTNFDNFYTDDGMGLVIDRFEDELFLAFNNNNKVNILTACSHRGITNICEVAMNQFNLQLGTIIGGFHLKNGSTEQYLHISHYFRMHKPKSLGICHCTGIERYSDLRNECDIHSFYNDSGNIINIV